MKKQRLIVLGLIVMCLGLLITLMSSLQVVAAQSPTDNPVVGKPLVFRTDIRGYLEELVWNFGDGRTSNQQNPSHTYTSPGTYTVTLTVTNPWNSAVATDTIHVISLEPTYTEVGINDGDAAQVILLYDAPFWFALHVMLNEQMLEQGVVTITLQYSSTFVSLPVTSDGTWTSAIFELPIPPSPTEPLTLTVNALYEDGSTVVVPEEWVLTWPYSWEVLGTEGITIRYDYDGIVAAGTMGPPGLEVSISHTPETPRVGEEVTFSTTITGYAESIILDFGDGITSTKESPVHAYKPSGRYTTTLTGRSPWFTAKASENILVPWELFLALLQVK